MTAWLDLFADDAVVQDPIGPSPFDPEGKGHHGRDAIAAFYDTVIAPSEAITFEITESYLCGDEVADVGIIRTTLAGGTHQAVVRGVYTYREQRRREAGVAPGVLGVRRAGAGGARGLTAMRVHGPRRAVHRRRPARAARQPLRRLRLRPLPPGRHLPLLRGGGTRARRAVAPRHALGVDGRHGAAARATRARSPTASASSSCPRACASSPG